MHNIAINSIGILLLIIWDVVVNNLSEFIFSVASSLFETVYTDMKVDWFEICTSPFNWYHFISTNSFRLNFSVWLALVFPRVIMAAQNTTGSVPYFLFYSLLTHFGTKHVNMCCVVKHTLKFLLIRPAFSHDVVHTLSVIIMRMYLFFTSSILLSLFK